MDIERERRVAENESMFRYVNEQVEEGHQRFEVAGPAEFLCECGDASCATRIFLTLAEYESVRADPRRFAIVPGHEIEEVERVVERKDRFAVVEKLGPGAEIAEEEDPRADR